MTHGLLQNSPEKAQRRIESNKSDSSSVQSFQTGHHPITQLQRTLGNRQVAELIQSKRLTPQGQITGLQRKLTVGAADDQYEQEADQVARQVISMPDAVVTNPMQRATSSEDEQEKMLQTKPLAVSISPVVQREISNEEDNESSVQAKSTDSLSGGFEAGGDVESRLNQSKGNGSSLPDSVRDYMEPRFGVDFSGVRVHTGNDAIQMNRDVDAQAFTHGSDIYFGEGRSPNNLELTAHELTHVIQQNPSTLRRLKVKKIQTSGFDSCSVDKIRRNIQGRLLTSKQEQNAKSVPYSGSFISTQNKLSVKNTSQNWIQKFESNEHQYLGDIATQNDRGEVQTIELAPGYFVSFGDITAMAGDFFRSVEEIRRLATASAVRGAGTREEIEYVRTVKIRGHRDQEESFSQEVRDAVMSRYYELAGNNSAHFTEPRGREERSSVNNRGNYRDNHEDAIREAVAAGSIHGPLNDALLYESFASHFLTDAFAAGHIRTERLNISDWWNPRVPMFWINLKLFIAEKMARHINDNTTIAGMLTIDQLWHRVRETIEEKNLPTLTFGDLVSGAVHDYDNEHGVLTQHGLLLGDGQVMDEHGALQAGGQHTAQSAIQAVQVSQRDIQRAYELGATGRTIDEVIAELMTRGQYAVEALWPQALSDNQQPQGQQEPNWRKDTVEALLGDEIMQASITLFAREKAATLEEALTFEDINQLGITVVSASLQENAFRTHLTNKLRSDPVKLLSEIISYRPGTGGGAGGRLTDTNALEYLSLVRTQRGLGALTNSQREQLIRDLVAGVCGDEEENAIIEILSNASVTDMVEVVKNLGGGDASAGIEYLDSGVDGAEWRQLKGILRRSDDLRPHVD